jgi:hypothetical protein
MGSTVYRSDHSAEREDVGDATRRCAILTKLPKVEHDAALWQAAMEALLLVAEHDGPELFARIGAMRALNRQVERVFNPRPQRPSLGAAEARKGSSIREASPARPRRSRW